MSIIEEQKYMTNLISQNDIHGATYSDYCFGQSDNEVWVMIPLPEGTSSRCLNVEIGAYRIAVDLLKKGSEVNQAEKKNSDGCDRISLLKGELYRPIKASESTWCIQDKKELVLTLIKTNMVFDDEWWPAVVKGHPQIDMKKFIPPAGNVHDLDDEGKAAVSKLMYEQSQKFKENLIE